MDSSGAVGGGGGGGGGGSQTIAQYCAGRFRTPADSDAFMTSLSRTEWTREDRVDPLSAFLKEVRQKYAASKFFLKLTPCDDAVGSGEDGCIAGKRHF